MKVLVTGAAGFIGYHLAKTLVARGDEVVGLDNINDYYDPVLKLARLDNLGVAKESIANREKAVSKTYPLFSFVKLELEDETGLDSLFEAEKFDAVAHMAAQAGVRYSLEKPRAYIQSNVVGFLNILECCRNHPVKHLVYASSSSVYGLNKDIPFSTAHKTDHPISLYAASKKSNELMAHTYSHLFGIPSTGLRFFTVYGPWGRPDMAMFLFTDAILKEKPIKVFNEGNLKRDFTYIDDIVGGVVKVLGNAPIAVDGVPYKLYNIGNNRPVRLMDFIESIEKAVGKVAIKEMLPMQPGDVEMTYADIDDLKKDLGYIPETNIETGVSKFIQWYLDYFQR